MEQDPAEHGRHVSNTAVRLVLEHVAREAGDAGVADVVAGAEDPRPVADLVDDSQWSSYGQFRRLLEAAGRVLGGPERLVTMGIDADLLGGSMPSATEMLQGLGSPGVLFAELDKGHAGLVTFLDVRSRELGPTEWIVETRVRPGFELYPEFCAFSTGLYPMTPRLFGYDVARVVEETCQLRGDDACRFHVRWDEGDPGDRQRKALEQRITLLERRMEAFQATVTDLVQADDLDTALERVVSAAARAVRAPGFVVVLESDRATPRQVYSSGLPPEKAAELGELLLAGVPHPSMELVAEIASSRRRYGVLAAYDPDHVVFAEGPMLAAYARLAATALDSATALEETRREANRARALLRLSATLAEIATTDEMATTLARAMPAVIGADQAAVAIRQRHRGAVRLVACHGHTQEFTDWAIGREMPEAADMETAIQYVDATNADEYASPVLERSGAKAAVVVPIVIQGEPEGWMVASVIDHIERLAPNGELEARLLGLAAQAATALRNARLVEQIRHQAMHDALTGLPNRSVILDVADRMMARGRRDRTPVAALFLDLDGFKEINDTLGHAAGDTLLQAVASRLAGTLRESDTLARLGGDEFVVLVDGAGPESGPEQVARRLLEVVRAPFLLEGREHTPLSITASIGIAWGADAIDAGDLLRGADVALYRAKSAGKDQAAVYTPEEPVPEAAEKVSPN